MEETTYRTHQELMPFLMHLPHPTPILNTNNLLDLEHNVNVPASNIYEILSKYFTAKMGTCEQIRTRCQIVRIRLPANCDVAFVNSELRMLFLDYKFRDIYKRELDEKKKITYLAKAFELHSDHRMKTCANQIKHDCITCDDLTYEIAVNMLKYSAYECFIGYDSLKSVQHAKRLSSSKLTRP